MESLPGGLLLVGAGVDVAPLKQVLQTSTFLDVSVAEEPQTALARGAALAAANAPLFASSTAALAYAQDPGTGAVDQYSLPDYLYVPRRSRARRRRTRLQRGGERGRRVADRCHREAVPSRGQSPCMMPGR
nr:hypothetical protein [Mycobacterium lepraemurium]